MMVLLGNSARGTGNRCSNKHVHRCPREERPLMGEWMDQRWHLHAMELGEATEGREALLNATEAVSDAVGYDSASTNHPSHYKTGDSLGAESGLIFTRAVEKCD